MHEFAFNVDATIKTQLSTPPTHLLDFCTAYPTGKSDQNRMRPAVPFFFTPVSRTMSKATQTSLQTIICDKNTARHDHLQQPENPKKRLKLLNRPKTRTFRHQNLLVLQITTSICDKQLIFHQANTRLNMLKEIREQTFWPIKFVYLIHFLWGNSLEYVQPSIPMCALFVDHN